MLELLRGGGAQPLLPEHFPVPVWWCGLWWYVPDDRPAGPSGEVVFHPAPADVAARFTRLASRLAAAPPLPRRHD